MAESFDFSNYVPNVHFELIPIKLLVSNQSYQRPISNAHVGRTAQNFNIYQINPVKVSRRDGTNYVFDGQHTIETVAIASGSRETPVWCMIYDDLGYEQEADIFANQKKHTRPLKSIEIFNANIEAENDVQMTIKSVVESYNLSLMEIVVLSEALQGSILDGENIAFIKCGIQRNMASGLGMIVVVFLTIQVDDEVAPDVIHFDFNNILVCKCIANFHIFLSFLCGKRSEEQKNGQKNTTEVKFNHF